LERAALGWRVLVWFGGEWAGQAGIGQAWFSLGWCVGEGVVYNEGLRNQIQRLELLYVAVRQLSLSSLSFFLGPVFSKHSEVRQVLETVSLSPQPHHTHSCYLEYKVYDKWRKVLEKAK